MKSLAIIGFFIMACLTGRGQISDFRDTDFSKADSIAELYVAHPLRDLRGLAIKLTGPLLTEQEKFRAIFKWVCNNIAVDYELITRNKRNSAKLQGTKLVRWNEQFNIIVFQTLLHQQKTICTGYAYLMRELSTHAGLSCEIVNGYANPDGIDASKMKSDNHSWNLIRLNGSWYLCDATWSSGIFSLTTGRFVKKYNDHYFLTAPSLFFRDHYSTYAQSRLAMLNEKAIDEIEPDKLPEKIER
jgi:transglutaminase/protease-like cytokinesis protein 3